MLKVVGASWMQIRMSTWIIGVVLVLGIVVVILGQMGQTEEDGNYSATVYWNHETGFDIKFWGQGMDIEQIPKGAARIYFQPHTDTTGWTIIDILTQSNYPDWVQAYAAGMLEGSLSWQLIYWHWKNTVKNTCDNREVFCNYIKQYLEVNLKSVKKHYENTEDPYWYQVYLFYVQLEGLQQGFEHGVKRSRQTIEELTFVDFLWMNAASDIVDLEYKFFDTKPYLASLNHSHIKNFISDSALLKKIRNLRSVNGYSTENENVDAEIRPHLGCGVTLGSSFVKLLPQKGQLFVAHNSAGSYVSMLKMIKHYHFKYHWSSTNFWVIENKLSFSSYPGAIHSMDDFYVVSVGSKFIDLVITGTPITVFDKKLWNFVSPWQQVLSGPRTIAACRLSKNATIWAENLSKYNSGTGNKQWLIIDAEVFNNISRLREQNEEKYVEELRKAKDIFLVAEQIPGHFIFEDQTQALLNSSYWASYGLPFYQNISKLTGVEKVQQIYGDAFSYENSPIANIYRRDHGNATSLNSIMKLMRSNSYRKDPLSLGDPRCAIGARGDIPIKTSLSFPIGVTDSKIFSFGENVNQNETNQTDSTSRSRFEFRHKFQIVAGPAFSLSKSESEGDDDDKRDIIQPFNWATSLFADFPHEGHPNNWEFEPLNIT